MEKILSMACSSKQKIDDSQERGILFRKSQFLEMEQRRLKGCLAVRRWIEPVAVGVVLIAAYLVLASRGQKSGLAYVQARGGCSFSGIYNFGDSNSDTGSVSATFGRVVSPYGETFFGKPSGRNSDGRLIIDFIAEKLGFPYLTAYLDSIGADFAHGANFAASGSTIQPLDAKLCSAGFNPLTLHVQILQFEQFKARSIESYGQVKSHENKTSLPKPESFSRALFTMDTGQNDLNAGLTLMTEEQVTASIPRIIDQFSAALEQLYKLGARAFWIHNTGPIGCLPFFVVNNPPEPNNSDPTGCIKSYSGVAQEFNKQLKEKISKLRSQLNDAMLIYVDIYSVKYSLISQGKHEGFTDPLGYCCGRLGMVDCGGKAMVNGTEIYGAACSNPSEYISWDSAHCTEMANKWVASRILDGRFSEPQVPIAEACYHPSQITGQVI